MQIIENVDGSFAIHKIYRLGQKYSVYYDASGKVKEADLILPNGTTKTVSKRSVHLLHDLFLVGKRARDKGKV